MFPPFPPDPPRSGHYWYLEQPDPKRRSFSRSLARFAVLVALLAGCGLLLSSHHVPRDVSSGLQDWEQE